MRAAVAALSLAAVAADWPQWRGPKRDGTSAEIGLLKEWPMGGPKLIWELKDIGDGYATPVVVGNRLYVQSSRGVDNEFVQALSVEDGKVLWTTRLGNVGKPDMQPSYPKARSTPAVDGDRLYALSSDGDLAALDNATGKVIWRKHLVRDFGGVSGTWAYAESPLVDGDLLVVTPGGMDATIVALNKRNGSVIWKSAVPGGDKAAYSSVVPAEAAGRKQYIQFLAQGVVGVDARTGDYLWRYDATSKGPANISNPVAWNGYVYSTNSRRFGVGLVQLHATGTGVSAEQVYFERDLPNTLGGQVLVGKHIYGTNMRGAACAEFTTGKLTWSDETIGAGSVLYADERLYFHSENGEMILVEATPEAYREKGRFTLPNLPTHATPGGSRDEKSWAYPVVANGRLYVRDLGTLWSFDVMRR